MELITKQKCNEHVCLLRHKDTEGETWDYILVPHDKMALVKDFEQGKKVDLNAYIRYIGYRDEHGVLHRASGVGKDPPDHLVKWIGKNYGPAAIDDNTTLVYTADDIRLCTMQLSSVNRSIGIIMEYHKHEEFYYVKPVDNFHSTLAFRAGVQLYDRLIEINGTSVGNIKDKRILQHLINRYGFTIQLLLCDPATYEYFKTNKKQLHSNLDTVKLLKPIGNNQRNDNSSSYGNRSVGGRGGYCAIRWRGTQNISVMSESSLRKSLLPMRLYQVYTIEDGNQNREARVIFKGSKADCEILATNVDDDKQEQTTPSTSSVKSNKDNQQDSRADGKLSSLDGESHEETTELTLKPEDREGMARRDHVMMRLLGMLMKILHDDNEDVHRVSCDGCHSLGINSDRYKCLQCENYDLCGSCFEKRRETRNHQSGHAFAHFKIPLELFGEPITKPNEEVTLSKFRERFANVEHTNVTCDGCEVTPILGIRFKCDTCGDYDLCLACMEKQVVTKEHDAKHPLIVIGKDRFNQIDVDDIELGEELGRGAFGAVHKAKWISKNRQVACKVLNVPANDERLEKSFLRELTAYTEISGAYILKLFGFAVQIDPENKTRKFLLVMEFMSRGSLTSVIKSEEKISLRRKLDMACHIASGMRKLHARHMIHRDIRSDNILVNEYYVAKIGDMGIARLMEANKHLTVVGCELFMPPEFVTGKYDQSLDVFTFGLTLNYLFTEKQHRLKQFIITKVELVEESPIFSELIARCIHDHPSQRPSAVEIEAILQTYKRGFDKTVLSEHPQYIQLPTETKNEVFLKFYEVFHPQAKAVLERQFPPPPPPPEPSSDGDDGAVFIQMLLNMMNKLPAKDS